MAGAARRAGVRPALYDAMSLYVGWDEIRAEIRRRRPRFVGSYAITATVDACLQIGRIVKEEVPEAVYVLGGVHPTFMWREILEADDSPVDLIVRGEGEATVENLLRTLLAGGDLSGVAGIAFKEGVDGGVRAVATRSRPFLRDLEEFPPAFDVASWPTYRYFLIPGGRLGAVSTSRGCNYTCTFCSQQKFWERSWRARDPGDGGDPKPARRSRSARRPHHGRVPDGGPRSLGGDSRFVSSR